MKLELAKGVRDIGPRDQIVREEIITKLKSVFVKYGFNPLETPILERLSTLVSKYAGGDEISKEIFKLKDQGDRELGLRYDLTVPFARYVGMNPQLKMPFKRYQIGSVFRDGPIKLGRFREFYQCDVDVVGTTSMKAEAEILELAKEVFKVLDLDVEIFVNNRKILDSVMDYFKIRESKRIPVILSLDKLAKVGRTGVEKELREKGLDASQIDGLFDVLIFSGSNQERLDYLKKFIPDSEGIKEMEEMLSFVEEVSFDPSLARGLQYYTGPVFEAFLKDSEIKSSLCGGGRYDKMVSTFLDCVKEYPATGISFGLEVILEALRIEKKIPSRDSVVDLFIIPIKTDKECFALVKKLRASGVKADIDLIGRNITKNLDYASKYGIPFVLIVGPKELESGEYKLKDMVNGREDMLSFEGVVKNVRKGN
jgi:histidyl-tRNA synthetase